MGAFLEVVGSLATAAEQGARYNDSVLNLLRLESERTPASRVALYRNLVDLMMQNRLSTQGSKRARIFEALGRLHKDVPVAIRKQVALTVAAQRMPQALDLISWLWAADPDHFPGMLPTLTLRETDWLNILPRLPQAGLAQLGSRNDMPDAVRRALASLGATGLGLPAGPAAELQDAPLMLETVADEPEQSVHLLPLDENAAEEVTSTDLPDAPVPDWTQFNKRLSEREPAQGRERIDLIARAVLGGEKIAVAASNDDQPVDDVLPTPVTMQPEAALSLADHAPQPLSDEAQQQIRDLIGRIAEFRKRWIDKVPAKPSEAAQADQTEALAVVADAIQAEVMAAEEDLSHAASETNTAEPEIIEPDVSEPLVLTPAVAANIGPARTTLPAAAQRDAAALADIAASLADFQWESDRAGRFLTAQSTHLSVDHGAGLVPTFSGRTLLGLFTDVTTQAMVERALTRRVAFRGAQFEIATGMMQGLWRMSGVPAFDSNSGLYKGHRGVAERLGPAALAIAGRTEIAAPPAASVAQLSTDKLATLAHETRTPLNAIMGFAQLIDGQAWGDVPDQYRARASAILEESNRLLRALDDVSDQAKLDRGAYAAHVSNFHPADVLVALREMFSAEAARCNINLLTRISDGLPNIWSDREAIERALGRLLVLALAGAKPQELVVLSARALPNDDVCFSISQPTRALPDADTAQMAEGFGVRLVRQLAGALSGRLDMSDRRYELIIPALVHLPEQHRERV